MKAIIIAAGRASRLMPLTNDKPKCMLEIKGKTIMQRQLEVFGRCGINDIVVVRGYKKEMITYPNLRYYENTNYDNNNILSSLFYAEREMNDKFIFSYSDILFKESILQKLLQSKAGISLVVDVDYIARYQHRSQHPIAEAELVTVKNNRITEIGKDIVSPYEAHGEFIGLAMFTKKGAKILRSNYKEIVNQYHNRPFQRAVSVENAYLTDMVQELIDRDYAVHSVDIVGGWMEIDTPEDFESADQRYE